MPKRNRLRRLFQGLRSAAAEAAFIVAPGMVARRKALKSQLDFQRRMQDQFFASRRSADADRLRGNRWLTSRLSPASELEADLETVRDRAFDLYENDPVMGGWVKTRVTNVVGTGMHFQARISPDHAAYSTEQDSVSAPKRSSSAEQAAVEQLNAQIEQVMRRQFAAIDRSGRKSLWRIQRLIERCYARDGEVLVVFSDKARPGVPLPLCVEVIAGNRLGTPPEKEGDERVRLGVESAEDGSPVAYWIRTTPPNDTKSADDTYQRIPADRVVHLYEEEEPEQTRGWPGCQSTMSVLKDCSDYDEAALIGRQVEACFAAFVKTDGNPTAMAAGISSETDASGNRLEQLAPGSINYLRPTESVEFANPGGNRGGDHAAYLEWQYHRIAAGLGISYEALLKLFGRTNYSAARSVRLDDQEEYRTDQQMLREVFLIPLYRRCLEQAVMLGLLPVTPREFLVDPDRYLEHCWIPSGWKWVDPLREVRADAEAVDEDFTTRTRVNAGRGMDDEERARERLAEQMRDARYEKTLREYRAGLGLDPEADPDQRQTAQRTNTPAGA